MNPKLLQIQDLSVSFKVKDNVVNVLNDISLELEKEASMAIVGESGSGKSMLTKAICGILPLNLNEIKGKISFEGKEIELINGIDKKQIGIILQNPMQSFNPTLKIGKFMKDVFEANQIVDDKNNSKKIQIIKDLGIEEPKKILNKYPYELSGGMLQRLAIGITLAKKPQILICDEPTTSLDVVTQEKIINLILDEKKKQGFTLIFITHDIKIVKRICNQVIIMLKGNIVEDGKIQEILESPIHPYTIELIKTANLIPNQYCQI